MNPSIAHLSPEQKRQLLAKLVQQKQQARRFPLSFAQQRLWFLDQLQPGSAAYNLPAAFRLEGAIDSSCLATSLQLLIQRHEGLRTSFGVHNHVHNQINRTGNKNTNKNANRDIAQSDPYQQIHSAASIASPLTIVDLRALPTSSQHRLMDSLMTQDCLQPFDLSRPPLLRATLLHLSETVAILLVTLHHIIADYWSLRILIRELTQIYQALRLGQAPALPDLPIQYADYAVWQRQWLNQAEHATQLAYWCDQLRDQTPLQLPTDFPRPKTPSGRGAKHAFQLTPEQTAALNQLSRESNTTLFMTLLAVFQILLHRYSGQSDISVGSTATNRNHPELSHLVGLFVNNLVLRTQIYPHLSVHQLLQQVREVTLAAYTHQTLPYEYLVEYLQPDRQLNINPLFQVSFVLHNTPQQSVVDLPDLKLHYLDPASPTARFDLSLDMAETPAGLVGVFEYNRDLFQPETIARLAGHFTTLIDGILANPNQRIAELPLLTDFEREQQVGWNSTEM
ncbi:MAG: non-ribosomal peptide synthetase, partial [Synechococcales cyanobacterium M58_A2018_015]|nr:non-ribosomal peptide synthetase [Synechococcales cyanobacterium M58_A2018_015]